MSQAAGAAILHVYPDAEATSAALAAFLLELMQDAVRERGRCRLALAGGSTPGRLYERLARPEFASLIPWKATHLYWSDERCVPAQDPASNYALAYEALIKHVALPASNVHRIDGSLAPESAARAYEEELGPDPLDIVLLGMGADGHTASLFPGGPELERASPRIAGRNVLATRSPVAPHERISLSLDYLEAARHVIFFVLGADKAACFARVMAERNGDPARATAPAAMLRPASGAHCFVDRAVAGKTQQT